MSTETEADYQKYEAVCETAFKTLATEADPYERAVLCDALCDAVEEVVGGQAVERLYNQGCRYGDLSNLPQ